MSPGETIGIKPKGNKLMTNRYIIFSLIVSTAFGYKPSSGETPYSAPVNASVQKIECGTESSPFNTQSPQPFQPSDLSRTDRDVDIPINYHVIYVAGDSIFINVTVDNQPYEHCSWDIRDYYNNTFLLYPGFGFDYPGHSYSLGGVLPPGNFSLFLYDEFGSGGISATVTTSDGTVLASVNQGQWGTYTFLDFTAPEGNYVDGLVSDEIIYEQTEVLNDHYNDLGYYFTVGSIDSAMNAGWYYATDSHKFETGQWSNDDQYLAMAQVMTVDVPTSVNFFWTGATLTSGLGVYPWSFDEYDSRHGLFCANYTFPGSDGTFSEGITGVHEVGHYFGLHHTFENGCSNPGDEVDDTPYQNEPNFGCPSSNYSCGSYDDIGNFMDYMDDDCLDHFTDGQVDRIEWALATYRPTLIEGTGYEGPVWYVSATGSDSTGDGSAENPFASIQFGLDSASESDTVSVSNGMYLENIIWPATNGIQLIGSGEENCVIDGDSTGRVITFHDSSNVNIDTTTHITGFTIQNGVSDLENITEKPGAGIYCVNASPMLTDCTIKENYAYGDGGGIALLDSSDMIIANIKFQDNMARGWRTPGQWPRYRGKGGGIFIVNSDPVLTNVEITDNYAGEYGGGVYLLYSSASFTNFTISGNIGSGSLQKGGGVSCESTPNATFTEGIIVDNVGPYLGGGIAVSPAMYDSSSFHVELTNVLIQNNTSRQWGGGIYGSNISLSGCTIKENTATYNGGGIYNEDFFSDGEISFSPTNRCNIYSNTVEDSSEVGNDIAINVDYYGIPQSFMEVILDTFTVLNPTDYYATPIDSFSFDILNGLETVAIDNEILPLEFALHPPYPNPFNPITTIRFDISVGEAIMHPLQLTVYDITGRVVDVLVNGKIESGQHEIQWNASRFSSGIYFVELVTGEKRDVQKLILLK